MASAKVGVSMDDRWQDLPGEILLEKVLPFVPFPDLCRFRAVCTTWNKRISEPAFQAVKTPYILLMAAGGQLSQVAPTMNDNWEIHDTKSRKKYVLNQNILDKLIPFTIDDWHTRRPYCYFRTAVAADKGFVCVDCVQYWILESDYDDLMYVMYVVNPVTQSYQEVPSFPRTGSLFITMSMIVTEDMRSFQLFVVQGRNDADHCCFVFDSRVGEWLPIADPHSSTALFNPCHILRMGKKLIAIFLKFKELRSWDSSFEIQVYDMEEDAWMHADVRDSPSRAQSSYDFPFWTMHQSLGEHVWSIPQLVACGGRLYFTVLKREEKIVIWEINLEENSCVIVGECAVKYVKKLAQPAEAQWNWNRTSRGRLIPEATTPIVVLVNNYWDFYRVAANMLSFGTDDGRILFSTMTRSSAAFSLSDGSWVNTPFYWNTSFMEVKNNMHSANSGTLGSMTTLTLYPVPEVAKPAAKEAV